MSLKTLPGAALAGKISEAMVPGREGEKEGSIPENFLTTPFFP